MVSRLHTDGASYFRSEQLRIFCSRLGIVQTSSPPHTPSLNGVAERTIRTVVEMGRTMLAASGLPRNMYGEAFMHSITTLNRLPASNGASRTRNEVFLARRLPEQHKVLKPFGCAAWAMNFYRRTKLEKKAVMHVLLGLDSSDNSYRLGTLPGLRLVRSGHVRFNEHFFPMKQSGRSEESLEESAGKLVDGVLSDVTFEEKSIDSDEEKVEEGGSGEFEEDTPRRSARGWKPSAKNLDNIASP